VRELCKKTLTVIYVFLDLRKHKRWRQIDDGKWQVAEAVVRWDVS